MDQQTYEDKIVECGLCGREMTEDDAEFHICSRMAEFRDERYRIKVDESRNY